MAIHDPLRVFTISLGCPKNRVDTEFLLGALGGTYAPAQDITSADVVLINTCAFIEPAVEESVQQILEVADDISDLVPRPLLAVTGCLVARYGQDLTAGLPEVDLWLPLAEQDQWGERLAQALGRSFPGGRERILTTGPASAYLKISEGCDHACRFCIIPQLRGPLQSRPVEELVQEAGSLVDQGARELVLVAQDVANYGQDLGMRQGLQRLVEALSAVRGLDWIRLLYLYPVGVTTELLRFLRDSAPLVVPSFDIPLQHAHPDILTQMGRPFARDPYRVIETVRDVLPQAALRTSLIVGYPGEKEAHFAYLRQFVQEVRFHNLGVFPYYAEEGTPAATLPDQVPEAVKNDRREQIMGDQAQISETILESCQGTTMDVLVERPDPHWPTLFQGRVWFQAPEVDGVTYVSGHSLQAGQLVHAEIEESKTYDLVALVPEEK